MLLIMFRLNKERKFNMKNYNLEVNTYGNVNGIPKGWHEVNVSVQKLRSFNIPFYKAHVGWNKRSKRHINPILVNIIPDAYKSVLTKKIKAEENKKEDKQIKWMERLIKFTGCTQEQAQHVASAVINKKYREKNELSKMSYDFHRQMRIEELKKQLKTNPLDYIRSKQQAMELITEHCK